MAPGQAPAFARAGATGRAKRRTVKKSTQYFFFYSFSRRGRNAVLAARRLARCRGTTRGRRARSVRACGRIRGMMGGSRRTTGTAARAATSPSEWGIEARHLRHGQRARGGAAKARRAGAIRRATGDGEGAVRPARLARDVAGGRRAHGMGADEKCVPATVERRRRTIFRRRGRSTGIPTVTSRAFGRASRRHERVRVTRRVRDASPEIPVRRARPRGARRGIARDPPVQPRRGANHAYPETTRTRD